MKNGIHVFCVNPIFLFIFEAVNSLLTHCQLNDKTWKKTQNNQIPYLHTRIQ